MTSDEVDQAYLNRAVAMFAEVTGKPCVNLDAKTSEVHYCHCIHELRIAEGVLEAACDWQHPADNRFEELTDGLAICSSLLDVGDDWWYDQYFNWYFVFTPQFVSRSAGGDHSWAADFLNRVILNRTIPRPPPPIDATHLLPAAEVQ